MRGLGRVRGFGGRLLLRAVPIAIGVVCRRGVIPRRGVVLPGGVLPGEVLPGEVLRRDSGRWGSRCGLAGVRDRGDGPQAEGGGQGERPHPGCPCADEGRGDRAPRRRARETTAVHGRVPLSQAVGSAHTLRNADVRGKRPCGAPRGTGTGSGQGTVGVVRSGRSASGRRRAPPARRARRAVAANRPTQARPGTPFRCASWSASEVGAMRRARMRWSSTTGRAAANSRNQAARYAKPAWTSALPSHDTAKMIAPVATTESTP